MLFFFQKISLKKGKLLHFAKILLPLSYILHFLPFAFFIIMTTPPLLSDTQSQALLLTLKKRFEAHPHRHPGIDWALVEQKLLQHPAKLASLFLMEESGGEPDVVDFEASTGEYTFCDCAAESPKGRRSLCFDRAAWESRKENKPSDNAMDVAAAMGVTILSEAQYRALQQLGAFDLKTSSWVATPPKIRALGGALFCDRRFDTVFVYHNGAESYYAARGFRASLNV